MNSVIYVVALILGAGLTVGFARGAMHRRDIARRAVERQEYEDRRRADKIGRLHHSVALIVDRYFPFVRDEFAASGDARSDPEGWLREVLGRVPGTQLGTTSIGFPAVLSVAGRRKHLAVYGRSGAGKSTLVRALVRDDLRAGRGLSIIGAEEDAFRDEFLPLVPRERTSEVIYFRPSDPRCTLTWNPLALEDGEDRALAASELFGVFKRAVGEDSIGVRADAILSSAFAVLVGRDGATLWTVMRLLEDEQYRATLVAGIDDPFLRDFWTKTFPAYPAGAILPLANRLNQFLRLPQLRAALCHPISSFSVREALANDHILYLDLSGFDVDTTKLLGRLIVSKLQRELMRRERIPEEQRRPHFVFIDEFHQFADAAEGSWRELLSRGRRYGLGLHLMSQAPHQLPLSLNREVLSNVSGFISLNVSSGDAATVRRELLQPAADGTLKPVPVEAFASLDVGEGYARLWSGSCALKVKFAPPTEKPDSAWGARVRQISWKTFAAPPLPPERPVAANVPAIAATMVPPPLPGRGSEPHKMIQKLAKDWAEALGFRATLEQDVLGGSGRVDIALQRDQLRIAVEVAVANAPAEIVQTVVKDVTAGFAYVIVVSADPGLLSRAETRSAEALPVKDRGKVRFLSPDGLRTFLAELGSGAEPFETTAGYRVRIEGTATADVEGHRALARLVGIALLRRRRSS